MGRRRRSRHRAFHVLHPHGRAGGGEEDGYPAPGGAGIELQAAEPVQALRQRIDGLLTSAQQAGAVRDDIQIAEVMALLTSTCQGALHAGWDDDLQHRTLTIIFNGLRPTACM